MEDARARIEAMGLNADDFAFVSEVRKALAMRRWR